MSIARKQIGWSNESNLLWDISNQLDRLTKVIAANTGGGGGTNPTSTFMPFNNAGTFADSFLVNDTANSVLKSVYGGNDIGLKLDFANSVYQFGQLNAGSQTYLTINDISTIIKTECINAGPGGDAGIYIDFINGIYNLGDYNSGINGTSLLIEDNSTQIIKTSNQGNDIGLNLNFANSSYILGDYNGISGFYDYILASSAIGIEINSNKNIFLGDVAPIGNYCDFNIDITNTIIKSRYNGSDIGLKLDFANSTYYLGDGNENTSYLRISPLAANQLVSYAGTGDLTVFEQSNNIIKTNFNNNDIGLKLDFANDVYTFGNNTTGFNFLVGNTSAYISYQGLDPVLLAGANYNISLGDVSSGGNSTSLTINDTTQKINLQSLLGLYNFANVPLFADNDAALAGGLVAGDIYILNDTLPLGAPRHLCIVY